MKLRNKKTGEIKVFDEVIREAYKWNNYNSLAELNEEWEDYEEPKTFWYMTAWGDVKEYSQDQFAIKQKQEIGNYFETEEETKKAVEKLKAWKRLKDKGFSFDGWKRDERYYGDFTITASDQISCDDKDLDLLFGGEE